MVEARWRGSGFRIGRLIYKYIELGLSMTRSKTPKMCTFPVAAFALANSFIPTGNVVAQVVPNTLPVGTCITAYGSSGRIVGKVQGGYQVASDADPTGSPMIVAAASAVVAACAGPKRLEAAPASVNPPANSTSRSGQTPMGRTAAPRPSAATTSVDNAAAIHRRIQQDNSDARSAKLIVGKYECRVGGQYTFTDLYITGAGTYRVEPGGTGAFTVSGGAINFSSGPYRGAYAQMVDGHTVGISSDGTHNLATQCER